MSASFIMIGRNAVVTAVTSAGKKTNLAHGNPSGEGPGIGKFSQKVRNTGPVSDSTGRNH